MEATIVESCTLRCIIMLLSLLLSLCALSILPHLRVLRVVGFYRVSAGSASTGALVTRIRKVFLDLYHRFALCVTTTYVLQLLIYGYLERSDLDKLSKVMFLLLCHITCVVKQVVFYFRVDEIDDLIASLDEPLMNFEGGASGTAGTLLRCTARNAVRLLKVYTGCAVATCVLWIVFPIVYRIQDRHFEFNFWIGLPHNDIFRFSAVLLYSFYSTSLVAVGNTTMDAFIVTVLDLCRVQLTVLRINFKTLLDRATATRDDCYDGDVTLKKLFIDCLVHYRKIIQICSTLQKIFSVPMLVQFGVSGWILCMAAYNIVSLNVLSVEFASNMLFITCILTEIFLYCYYGNEVTVESDRVCESIYSMQWLRAPVSFQRSLVVVMERAKRPLRPTAGLIIPLTLDTFVTILKSSYSFYAVLRQTKETST